MRNFYRILALPLALLAAIIYYYMSETNTNAAIFKFNDLAAVQTNGQLQLTIPFEKVPANASSLLIELLDAEDHVVAKQSLTSTSDSAWTAKLGLPLGLKREDLVWYRLHYSYISDKKTIENTYTVGEVLRYPIVRLIGQKELTAGVSNSVRIITLDARTGEPITGNLQLEVSAKEKKSAPLETLRASLDEKGTVEPRLRLPQDYSGSAELRVKVSTPLGNEEFVEPVNIVKRETILLTTDKPIYQPSHLIHIRSLALDRFSRQAAAGRPLIFEIEDAKGNKVFKQRTTTNEFGVSSAQFQLAEEVNMGTFKLRAILGEPDSPQAQTQERSFVVDRYVLPKFKIDIKLGRGEDERQKKKYYTPGETVSGRIDAKYIFGKPLQRAKIRLKLSTFDVQTVELESTEGLTDETGSYGFAMKLPEYFAGRSFEQGAAPVALTVEVTDSANHTESKAESLLVSNNPILITAVPESGEVVKKLTNRVYLLTSYPDGSPAVTKITGNIKPAVLTTGSDGIAEIEIDGNNTTNLQLRAQDNSGKVGTANISLKVRDGNEDSLMLRTDRPLYRVGEKVEITTVSTKNKGAVYIDVIKDRQTILTRALDLENGQAKMDLDLGADLFGTIEVRAYIFGRNADPISDRRIIFVDPADDLQIDAEVAKESFRPGEEAEIKFAIKDKFGKPKFAIIDVQVVDEAVFALSERQPGFEKVFFYLQEELLKPRYEIHGVGNEEIVPLVNQPPVEEEIARRQRAASVLLAAATEVNSYTLRNDYGKDKLKSKSSEYYEKYYKLATAKVLKTIEGLNRYYATKQVVSGDLNRDIERAIEANLITYQDSLDPWGKPVKYQGQMSGNYANFYTNIDLPGTEQEKYYIYVSGTKKETSVIYDEKPFAGSVKIDEGIGPDTGYAQIAGTITDKNKQPLANAQVKVRRQQDGRVFNGRVNQQGAFQFTVLKAGSYELTVQAAGHYSTSYRWIEVKARDQAYVTVPLEKGSAGAVMQLTAMPSYYGIEKARGPVRRRAEVFEAAPMPQAMAARPAMEENLAVRKLAKDDVESKAEPERSSDKTSSTSSSGGDEGIKVRSYFPETLYVNPTLITDKNGRAMVRIPMADSITTWRMTMLASTKNGALGSSTSGIKVFQDFFIDIDLPVAMTQDDSVTVPVVVYNYLQNAQDVEVTLKAEDWFTLDGNTTQTIRVGAGEVSAVNYRIKATRIGTQKLTATARLTQRNSVANGDAIARQIEIIPNGEQQNIAINDRLETSVAKELTIPENAIANASKILVKFYPGPLSQVVEGLDSILRMPSGCFEQTSATTYPNVLVLDYMKTTKKITPEIQAKAEGFISLGYQKLVTFEVPGGGYSWFGQAPANKILTSFGLMQFYDMSKVHEVDPRVIKRTQDWLASQQNPDGSWNPDKEFIDEGATNNFHNDQVRIAAYIGWALAYSGYNGQATERAKQFVEKNVNGKEDSYTLAVIANFAADFKKDKGWTERSVAALVGKVVEEQKTASWGNDKVRTATYARDDMAQVETTALAVQALIKAGLSTTLASKGLQYLTEKKDAFGNWHSTQATILSLKAFLLSQKQGSAVDTEGTIAVSINGQHVKDIKITRDNNDLMHQLDLKQYTSTGKNRIEVSFNGKGSMLYQVVGRYYKAWKVEQKPNQEPLSIDLKYDRTTLAQDDIATATVTVRNNLRMSAKMVMIDLGIPPGFEVEAEDFQSLIGANPNEKFGQLTKFSLTPKQIVLYLDGLRAGQTFTAKYRLKAKYPLKAKTMASKVYQYYNPEINATVQPIELSVVEKKR